MIGFGHGAPAHGMRMSTTSTPSHAVDRALPPRPGKPFDLLRHFSIACLLGMLVAIALAITMVGSWARDHVLDQGTKANADLATVFANGAWIEHGGDIRSAAALAPDELPSSDAVANLRVHTLEYMRGTAVVKIKLYNLDGLTLFSTDPKQIGSMASGNDGIRAASAGRIASTLTHRDTFDAFEGTLENRDVLASYVPMRATAGGRVEAVLEIYSDVTDMLATLQRSQWRVGASVAVVLLALYAFLFLVVRKADRIIRRHGAEHRQREADIWHQAHHDPLTGLPNRSLFARDLDALIAGSADAAGAPPGRPHPGAQPGQPHAGSLLYVDLDRFKMVNDGFGHQAGDAVLKAAAERMRGCLRADDRLYRIGGDEFAILLAQVRSPADVAAVASRISQAMARPIDQRDQRFQLGATIGIALIPHDGNDADSLVSNANAAMRSAKRDRRGEHRFYSEEMNERTRTRLALEAELRRAHEAREFVLHYQPRVSSDSGIGIGIGSGVGSGIGSVEALIRWQRPGHGLVPPGQFIDVLEQMDLMTSVGEWVLRTACEQLRRWHEQGHVRLGVSVNVSARQLDQPDFTEMVNRVIADTGVDPRAVELELTESVLIERTDHAGRMLSALRAKGLRIAIDDFGTGHASLTYLRQLAVDVVKLDRSFVGGVEHNPKDRALSTAIAEMARALGLTLVAEGVETEAQVRFLESIHCTEMQGFLFSRPQPPERLDEMLAVPASRGATQRRLDVAAFAATVV